MDSIFKKGDLVVNSSGTYAKVVAVNSSVVFCSPWYTNVKDAIESSKGGVQFNERAMNVCGIVLAKTRTKPAQVSVPKTAKELKAEKEAKEAKAKNEVEKKENSNELDLIEDEDIEEIIKSLPDVVKAEIYNEEGYVEITQDILDEYPELVTAGAELGQKIKIVA